MLNKEIPNPFIGLAIDQLAAMGFAVFPCTGRHWERIDGLIEQMADRIEAEVWEELTKEKHVKEGS